MNYYPSGATEFTYGFSGVRVDQVLAFLQFFFKHCFVLLSFFVIVLSVHFRYAASDYPLVSSNCSQTILRLELQFRSNWSFGRNSYCSSLYSFVEGEQLNRRTDNLMTKRRKTTRQTMAIVLSVLLRFTDSNYPFSIFKLFNKTQNRKLNIKQQRKPIKTRSELSKYFLLHKWNLAFYGIHQRGKDRN